MNEERFWNLLAKKLSGEASAEEKAEWEAFLQSQPDLSSPSQQIAHLWQAQKSDDRPQSEEAFQKHWQKLHDGTKEETVLDRPRRKAWLLSFATLILLAAGAWFLLTRSSIEPAKTLSQKAEISTQKGDRTKLVLPDSSEVWLNAGSKLSYEPGFGTSNRKTTLVGEAFFDVKKARCPFLFTQGGYR